MFMSAEEERQVEIQRKLREPVTIEVTGFDGKPVTLTGVTIGDIHAQMLERGLYLVEPVTQIADAINQGLENTEITSSLIFKNIP